MYILKLLFIIPLVIYQCTLGETDKRKELPKLVGQKVFQTNCESNIEKDAMNILDNSTYDVELKFIKDKSTIKTSIKHLLGCKRKYEKKMRLNKDVIEVWVEYLGPIDQNRVVNMVNEKVIEFEIENPNNKDYTLKWMGVKISPSISQ